MDKQFKKMVDRMTLGKDVNCKTCGIEMVPMEFVLRKGECVMCKTKREFNKDENIR